VIATLTEPGWPAIVTAGATVLLAVVAAIQIRAGRAQTREQAETVKRGWQPRVCARPFFGKHDRPTLAPNEMAVPYFLNNDGTGPAFNVECGIKLPGQPHITNKDLDRVLQAGEGAPTKSDPEEAGQHWLDAYVATVNTEGRSVSEVESELVYWTRFENLMGERFEVRNPRDTEKPAEFRRIS
jgi:hypothetical protein